MSESPLDYEGGALPPWFDRCLRAEEPGRGNAGDLALSTDSLLFCRLNT